MAVINPQDSVLYPEPYITELPFDEPKTYIILQHKETGKQISIERKSNYNRSRARMVKRIKNALKKGIHFRLMITLTYDDIHIKETKNDIRRFLNRMKTYYRKMCPGKKIEYFWAFGTESDGERNYNPHYHVIVDTNFISIKRIESWWEQGFVQYEKLNSREKALNYVGKYIAKKQQDREGTLRRYGCSRGIPPTPKKSEWEFIGELVANFPSEVYQMKDDIAIHNEEYEIVSPVEIVNYPPEIYMKPLVPFQEEYKEPRDYKKPNYIYSGSYYDMEVVLETICQHRKDKIIYEETLYRYFPNMNPQYLGKMLDLFLEQGNIMELREGKYHFISY